MGWLRAVDELRRRREPGVLVTVVHVRGHAPRRVGARMVVAASRVWDSVGGGNLEAVALDRAAAMLAAGAREPETLVSTLSEKAAYAHGIQCCGGEVTLLLEPLPVRPAVAIFGMGHVGHELARILARHDLDLHLVDTRRERFSEDLMAPLDDAEAVVRVHHPPLMPEQVLEEVPAGAHVLVMTHDHAEDLALVDASLRRPDLGSIGLIGSATKWARFRTRLTDEFGHDEDALARVTTPIGLADLPGKEPATIALGVAAQILVRCAGERPSAG